MLPLLLTLARADDTFFLGSGPERTSLADLVATGAFTGRTGALVAHLDDPHALDGEPRILEIRAHQAGIVRLTLSPGVDDLALARALHDRPGVRWIHPELRLGARVATIPEDPLFVDEWHLVDTEQGGRTGGIDINAAEAWDYATGAGITIAVIDSGVQLDHPDLVVTPGHDYIDKDDDPSPGSDDSAPHGTGVAGIAAARGDNGLGVAGVAWEADIYAIRLIGGATTLTDLVDSFTEAVDAGASVLSNSWGFYGCDGVANVPEFGEMFDYAEKQGRGGLGSVVVFAAGNDNCDASSDGMLGNRFALVVAALEWNDVRSWYSNYGEPIDIAAPTSVLTTDITPGGYGSYGGDDAFADGFSGTSGATPVVSGVVALMLEANPRLTAKQVRETICATGVRNDLANAGWDAQGWSPYYGCGRIDAGAAVATVADTAPEAPVPVVMEQTYVDRVILSWAPAVDADRDVVDYTVTWWTGSDTANAHQHTEAATTLDLTGNVDPGSVVSWTVLANDVWGPGPASATQTVTILETPGAPTDTGDAPAVSEPAACGTTTPEVSGNLLVLTALAAAFHRGRRR